MSWKKSLPFFIWQSVRYAKNPEHFRRIWTYRKQWQQSLEKGRNSMIDELPWLTFPAIDFLREHVFPKSSVFEFGGGGSTLFFCKNVGHVATVEHHEGWFETLTETIENKGYAHWQGFFVAPEPQAPSVPPADPADPAAFRSGAPGLDGYSFEKYARTIDQYPPEFFDLILVDGRARPSCMQQAIPHLKTGGYLVIDNTERKYYLARFKTLIRDNFKVILDEFAPGNYVADFTKTTILQKLR